MVKNFKTALLYALYLTILIGTSLVACWVIGALFGVAANGYEFTVGYF